MKATSASTKKSSKKTSESKGNGSKKRNVGEFLQETIVEAAGVAKQIEELTVKLEALKSAIRDHALPLIGSDQNSLTIDTDLGKCHIVKVKDHLVFAPGVEADVLEKNLPEELFNLLFVKKPQLRPTATDAFLRLTDEQRIQLGEPAPFLMAPRQAQVRLPK